MAIKYDVVKCERYTGKDNVERTRYTNIGRILHNTETGNFSLKLDSIPVLWDGWASLFEPKPKEAKPDERQKTQESSQEKTTDPFGGDIPF